MSFRFADDPDDPGPDPGSRRPGPDPFTPEPTPDPQVAWWRNVAERAIRQALQVAAPVLAAVVASGNGLDWRATIGGIAVSVALSVLKAVGGLRADADAPQTVQIADRALAAFAFTLASFLPVDWLDWASVDWSKALYAAIAAGVLAVVQFYLNPPSLAVSR